MAIVHEAGGDSTVRAKQSVTGRLEFSAERQPGNFLKKTSTLLYDLTNPAVAVSSTDLTSTFSTDYSRWNFQTRKIVTSSATAQLRKTALSLLLDPTDQLLSLDVYLPHKPTGSEGISISLFNSASWSANFATWTFNLNALRQGWNTLKCWCGDTDGVAGAGTLGFGCGKSKGGTGFDPAQAIGYFEITFMNASGKTYYVDSLRKGAKTLTSLVMGFDATGYGYTDDTFVKAGGLADVMKQFGAGGYFTVAPIYDLAPGADQDIARKHTLYSKYGWDALNHFWSHGGSYPGGSKTISTLVRASNLVTATTSAAHNIPVGTTFYSMIAGASVSDMNGLQLCTATGASSVTYTAAGADGSATGTMTLSTFTADVINADTATTRAILRHEIVDTAKMIRARGWDRAAHIGAYPNNSVGELSVHQAICAECGIKYFRGVKKTAAAVTEFGVDNPLHFGSYELGDGGSGDVTTLQTVKDKLAGAMGRGEDLWLYGHYVLDETTAAGHSGANTDYPPGNNGNPAAPSVGGWWYLGTVRKLLEYCAPLVASGDLVLQRPSDWVRSLGNV